jgi:hypothetical protein
MLTGYHSRHVVCQRDRSDLRRLGNPGASALAVPFLPLAAQSTVSLKFAQLGTASMRRLALRTRMRFIALAGILPLLRVNLGTVYVTYKRDLKGASTRNLSPASALTPSIKSDLRMRIAALENPRYVQCFRRRRLGQLSFQG